MQAVFAPVTFGNVGKDLARPGIDIHAVGDAVFFDQGDGFFARNKRVVSFAGRGIIFEFDAHFEVRIVFQEF